MTPMKFKEVVSLLESNGFTLIRSNGHQTYAKGVHRVVLAHQRMVSPGVLRGVLKTIKQANTTPSGQVLGNKAA